MANPEQQPAITRTEAKFTLTGKGRILVAMAPLYEAAERNVESVLATTGEMLRIERLTRMSAEAEEKQKNKFETKNTAIEDC